VEVRRFGTFTHRIPLRFDNANRPQRDDWPVTMSVNSIRKIAPDFNPDNCAVVAPERWLDWRQIAHQVDEIDPAIGKEISFLIDLRANTAATYYLYYSPTGKSDKVFPAKTATAEDWVPPNIGWENTRIAYRTYWLQFDFFGKKVHRLVYPTIGKTSYHDEVEWGIDALNVGDTSGAGGPTLYMDDKAYLVQNPSGKAKTNIKFTKRQVVSGPVRAAVDILAEDVVPEKPNLKVRVQALIYAERQETEIRATVIGADGEVFYAPGFMKLDREHVFSDPIGCAGIWGYQVPVIGEIGLGLIVSPDAYVEYVKLPLEHRVKLRLTDNKIRYWLIADWRRGRQHPVNPTIENWQRELRELADVLLNDVAVNPGQPEAVR